MGFRYTGYGDQICWQVKSGSTVCTGIKVIWGSGIQVMRFKSVGKSSLALQFVQVLHARSYRYTGHGV